MLVKSIKILLAASFFISSAAAENRPLLSFPSFEHEADAIDLGELNNLAKIFSWQLTANVIAAQCSYSLKPVIENEINRAEMGELSLVLGDYIASLVSASSKITGSMLVVDKGCRGAAESIEAAADYQMFRR